MSIRKNEFATISVFGLGYIGLPTAALFATQQRNVIGIDINADIVNRTNQGQTSFIEPELNELVKTAVSSGYLRASLQPEQADVFLIAVPTPFQENHTADLSYIQAAALSIAPILRPGNLVILESTSPVGTTEQLASWLAQCRPDLSFPQTHGEQSDIRMAYCPERVFPGQTLHELVQNDRVIGGMTRLCADMAVALYQLFVMGECSITTTRTAEMCKLAENSFRDVNIAFANELSMICDKLHINVWELIQFANRHPRVNILQPGPGVGGHCIAVDPWFIVGSAPEEAKLIKTAREVNDSKPLWVCKKVEAAIAEFLQDNPEKTGKDITITCFGLAFKPDIDDLRESPAIQIVQKIAKFHIGPLYVVEPHIKSLPTMLAQIATLTESESILNETDIILMLVDHKIFKGLPKPTSGRYRLIDTRGVWL